MVELAIWILSFIIVVWAIIAIGIPLLILGTAVVVSARKIIAGIASILLIVGALSCYESSPQLGLVLGLAGFVLFIYSLSNENTKQHPITSRPKQANPKDINIVLDYDTEPDDMFIDAVKVVVESGKASSSLLQRHLNIGYARAARLIEEMENQGIIGPPDGSRPRDVLISSLDEIFGNKS